MMYFYLSTWGILIAKNWGKLISCYNAIKTKCNSGYNTSTMVIR